MAESLGVCIKDVFQTLETYLGSTTSTCSTSSIRASRYVSRRAQLSSPAGRHPDLYVTNRNGQMVPLGAIMNIRRTLGTELMTRYNLYPAAPIIGGRRTRL